MDSVPLHIRTKQPQINTLRHFLNIAHHLISKEFKVLLLEVLEIKVMYPKWIILSTKINERLLPDLHLKLRLRQSAQAPQSLLLLGNALIRDLPLQG